MRLWLDELPSPIGPILVAGDAVSVCAIDFGAPEERLLPLLRARFGAIELQRAKDLLGAVAALSAYLAGDFAELARLPVDGGGTPFQRRVWAELRRIPPGKTTSYGALARRLGKPGASRAVGHANGQNPISIAVPCHRVLGADGALAGYGGGLRRKRWLLQHESAALSGARV